jgi:hypothetical protein
MIGSQESTPSARVSQGIGAFVDRNPGVTLVYAVLSIIWLLIGGITLLNKLFPTPEPPRDPYPLIRMSQGEFESAVAILRHIEPGPFEIRRVSNWGYVQAHCHIFRNCHGWPPPEQIFVIEYADASGFLKVQAFWRHDPIEKYNPGQHISHNCIDKHGQLRCPGSPYVLTGYDFYKPAAPVFLNTKDGWPDFRTKPDFPTYGGSAFKPEFKDYTHWVTWGSTKQPEPVFTGAKGPDASVPFTGMHN